MGQTARNLKLTLRFSLITPVLLLAAVILMGGGHGYFEPAIILFPLGMVGIIFFDQITIPFILLALLQYPLYGYMLDKNRGKGSGRWQAIILVVHACFVILILMLKSDHWS